jgi:hypothetical protein
MVPLLLRVYGLKPWELDRLTFGEQDAIVDDMKRGVTDG